MKFLCLFLLPAALLVGGIIPGKKKQPPPAEVPLDQYVRDADSRVATDGSAASPGSTWSNFSFMTDLVRDPRAGRIDDVVTILVNESASAVSTGATATSRKSSVAPTISSLPGFKSTAANAILSSLPKISNDTELNGQGTTSRTTTLSTNLTARVVHVLPNGFLVIEGTKNVQINSEWQTVTVRGVVRPADLAADNTVSTERIAELNVKLDGKGVVNDAIRRPNFLYRMLLGLLPF